MFKTDTSDDTFESVVQVVEGYVEEAQEGYGRAIEVDRRSVVATYAPSVVEHTGRQVSGGVIAEGEP